MTLLILCLAAVAMVCYSVSALIGSTFWLLRRPIAKLAPVAQARLFLFAALLPFIVAFVVLLAALAPSFGWISDHYSILSEVHNHPHLCFDHQAAGWPAFTLTLLALLLSVRVILTLVLKTRALVLSHQTRKNLSQLARTNHQGIEVLPSSQVQAFVIGLFRPTLYVTDGLACQEQHQQHLPAVIAHERAHMRRLDPLRRLVGGLGLCFHLPGVARWIETHHARAQEMAADEVAARELGSPDPIASALIALAKAQVRVPMMAVAMSQSDIQERVLQLMEEREGHDWPSITALATCAVLALLLVAMGADGIHHQVESWLGALG